MRPACSYWESPDAIHAVDAQVGNPELGSPETDSFLIVGETTLQGVAEEASIHKDFDAGTVDIDIHRQVHAGGILGTVELAVQRIVVAVVVDDVLSVECYARTGAMIEMQGSSQVQDIHGIAHGQGTVDQFGILGMLDLDEFMQ